MLQDVLRKTLQSISNDIQELNNPVIRAILTLEDLPGKQQVATADSVKNLSVQSMPSAASPECMTKHNIHPQSRLCHMTTW